MGTEGGAINSSEGFLSNIKILGNPNNEKLSHILASVDLAQNLPALCSLVSEGIQKGHLSLHAKNICKCSRPFNK